MQLIEVGPRDHEPKTELDDSIQFHKVPVVFVSKSVLEDIRPYVEQPEAQVFGSVVLQLNGNVRECARECAWNERYRACSLTSNLFPYCCFDLVIPRPHVDFILEMIFKH